MRALPRSRRLIKRCGVVLLVLMMLVWIASLRWTIPFPLVALAPPSSRGLELFVTRGAVVCRCANDVMSFQSVPGVPLWGFYSGPQFFAWPLWVLFVLVAVPTALLWRRDAAARATSARV